MKIYGNTGTVINPQPARINRSFAAPIIDGSITVTPSRGMAFTLHRIPGLRLPARFYMTHDDRPGIPVYGDREDDKYWELYTVFTVKGDVLAEGGLLELETDDGFNESHWVRSLRPAPRLAVPPVWMRNGKRGHISKSRGRPPGS